MTLPSAIELGEIMPQRSGSVNPIQFQDELFDLYSIPAYDSGKPEILTGRSIGSTKQLVKEGDVLLSKIVPHIRRCWVIGPANGKRQIASGEWIIFRNSEIETGFLRHFLLSNSFHQRFMKTVSGVGGSLLRARPSEVAKIDLPIPTRDEQVRIATTLDKADAIRKKRRDALKLADEFLRSVFLNMFGDPVTNPKGWDELPIKNIAIVTTGNTPSRQVLDYFGNHIEWIKSDNINTSSHHLTKATEGLSQMGLEVGRSAPAGSTLVTCIAGSPACIGNAALSDRRVAFNQQINALTPKPGIEPEFLYAVTLFSKIRIQAASTNGMKGMVSKGALEQVHFILPPKPERQVFVRIFEKVLSTLRKMHVASDESDHLFESLQQQTFA